MMSKAIVLDENFARSGELDLPSRYDEINEHNLYLYVKSYLSSIRANGAHVKTRGLVSGGGKKPWSQKGGGRARAGSITSPVFVGGGVSHGPSNNKNYILKVNKKQRRLALEFALKQKAQENALFVVDSIKVESGKTKDAFSKFQKIGAKSVLFVTSLSDEKTFLSFRNLRKCYLSDADELNAYLVSTFRSVVIEREVFEEIVKRG